MNYLSQPLDIEERSESSVQMVRLVFLQKPVKKEKGKSWPLLIGSPDSNQSARTCVEKKTSITHILYLPFGKLNHSIFLSDFLSIKPELSDFSYGMGMLYATSMAPEIYLP